MSKADSRITALSRRAAIAATLSVTAIPCSLAGVAPAALPPDPILAAIAMHWDACARFEAACRLTSALERQIPAERRKEWFREDREAGLGAGDDPRWTAAVAAGWAACDAEDRAAWALARIRPASLAGAATVLRYVRDHDRDGCGWPDPPEDGGDDWHGTFHLSLAAALEGMASLKCGLLP